MHALHLNVILVLLASLVALHAFSTASEDAERRGTLGNEGVAEAAAGPIPSFSRQTGLSCSACHTSFPQLTAFGRQFKADGYTLSTGEAVEQKEGDRTILSVNRTPPLSAMLIASVTDTRKAQPGTQNWDADFPQEVGLFIGGKITPHLGGFVQFTYDPAESSIAVDNLDVRYAHQGTVGARPLVYGLTLNNNPTVQDLWNATPAWGYPYTASQMAPTPAAATLLDGGLGQTVVGLGGYLLWNDLLYGELTGYRSAPQGAPNPPDGTSEATVRGLVPYWRLALQQRFGHHAVELGTFGLVATLYPTGVSQPTDRYTDLGMDVQYEVPWAGGTVAAHGIWIHEKQSLDASFAQDAAANRTNVLQTLRVDAGYLTRQRIGVTGGVLHTTGDADALLYAPETLSGSRTGRPNSTGLLAEVSWMPWINTRFGVQYVWWTRFNGTANDYDGSGRAAADNDTFYLYTWLAF